VFAVTTTPFAVSAQGGSVPVTPLGPYLPMVAALGAVVLSAGLIFMATRGDDAEKAGLSAR
jgi:hypothetical protein